MEKRTLDEVLAKLKVLLEDKTSDVKPSHFLEWAQFLNMSLHDERIKLALLQQGIAKMKTELLASGNTAVSSRIKVEASNEYVTMLAQKSKIEMIIEYIRICKLQSKMSMDEFKGY